MLHLHWFHKSGSCETYETYCQLASFLSASLLLLISFPHVSSLEMTNTKKETESDTEKNFCATSSWTLSASCPIEIRFPQVTPFRHSIAWMFQRRLFLLTWISLNHFSPSVSHFVPASICFLRRILMTNCNIFLGIDWGEKAVSTGASVDCFPILCCRPSDFSLFQNRLATNLLNLSCCSGLDGKVLFKFVGFSEPEPSSFLSLLKVYDFQESNITVCHWLSLIISSYSD